MNTNEWMGVLRHILTVAGGGLITNGYVTEETWQSLTGGVVALVVVGWSIANKRGWIK